MSLDKQKLQEEQIDTSSSKIIEIPNDKKNAIENKVSLKNPDKIQQRDEREKADKVRIEQIKTELQKKTKETATGNLDLQKQEILKNIEQKIKLIDFNKNTEEELKKKKELAYNITRELINNDDPDFKKVVKELVKEKIIGNMTIDKVVDQKYQKEIQNDIIPHDFQDKILKEIAKNHLKRVLMGNLSSFQIEEIFSLSSDMIHGWNILDNNESKTGKYIEKWVMEKYPEGTISKLKRFIKKENPKEKEEINKKIAFLEGMLLKEILITNNESSASLLKGKKLKTLTEPFKEKLFQFRGKKFDDRIPQILVAISKLRGETENDRFKTLSSYGSIVEEFINKIEEDSGAKKGTINTKYGNVLERIGKIKKDFKIFG